MLILSTGWMTELEQRNDQSALLRKMSEMVQVCHTADEIFRVMHQYVLEFFPVHPDSCLSLIFPRGTWNP